MRFDALSQQQSLLLEQMLDDEGIGSPAVPTALKVYGPAAPSFGQERLYLLEQLQPGSAGYSVAGALRLEGELNTEALQRAVDVLVDRHDVLRTSFAEGPTGEVIQIVAEPGQVSVPVPLLDVAETELDGTVRRLVARGFDLGTAPLLRAWLLRVPDGAEPHWLLVLCVHHIAVDGWSLGILVEELVTVYLALNSGREPDLPPIAATYVDYAAAQRSWLAGEEADAQLGYWREKLDGASTTEMPIDRPRSAMKSGAGDRLPAEIRPETAALLRELAESTRTTMFMVLVTSWAAVLSRWSGHRDIVVAAPVKGRSRTEFDGVVGFFANTLPIRIRPGAADTFRELLDQGRRVCLEAYGHQDLPFDRIVQELRPARDAGGQVSWARHALTLNTAVPTALRVPGLDIAESAVRTDWVRFDLELQLSPTSEGGLSGILEYSTELFDRETAGRILTAFDMLLGAVAADPDVLVDRIPVLPEADIEILKEFSGMRSEPLSGPVAPRWFESQADATPSSEAVLVDETGATVTYRELDRLADRTAGHLGARGIRAEDVVGICLERGVPLVTSVLGVFKAGAAYLPLEPGYPQARLDQLIADGRPSLIITEGVARFPGREDLIVRPDMDSSWAPRPGPEAHPDGSAYVLFTSGSTGRPKGVVNSHAGLVNRLTGMQRAYRLGPGDRVLQKTPIGFDVSVWELLLPLVTGATLVFARPDGQRDPGYLHEVIDRRGITVCHFVPSMLTAFLDGPDVPHPTLRTVICSGEELPASLAARFLARYPAVDLHNQYGPTEAAIDVSEYHVRAPVPDPVPIGRPVPGAQLWVLDERFQLQPVGVPGELYIGGVQNARGYTGRPGLTAERFVPHPFASGQRLYATGDRARLRPGGEVEFLGRLDHQIKIRGNRVEPGEIESVLRAHDPVGDAVVLALPGKDGQPRLLAYVTVTGPEDERSLRRFLRERLPGYMVPVRVLILEEWPVGPNGKLDRAALPLPELLGEALAADHVDPRTPLEEEVAAIWRGLLGLERIGVHDDFFDLGGHSLIANRVIVRIKAELGAGLTLRSFFDAPTVAGLAAEVSRMRRAGARPALPPLRRVDRERYRVVRDEA